MNPNSVSTIKQSAHCGPDPPNYINLTNFKVSDVYRDNGRLRSMNYGGCGYNMSHLALCFATHDGRM